MENNTHKYLQIYARYMTYTMIPPEIYVVSFHGLWSVHAILPPLLSFAPAILLRS